MRHALPVLLLLALSACATVARSMGGLPPGYGVSEEMAAQVCASVEFFEERKALYMEQFREQHAPVVPVVGDNACIVFAKIGMPTRTQSISHRYGEAMILTYEEGGVGGNVLRIHTIHLEPTEDNRNAVVTLVSW